ncbi:hypothetical protein PHMEG_00027132 [Phytophthora megakarya]|uniref:Uncharacterized protein n=1 Tax=Phytophthora megakarya TaxID=4795 RepID=A0A225V7L6_9STRA|nr:hypothetical protein PHMEG_00027132 [Phytophthora megakarya]
MVGSSGKSLLGLDIGINKELFMGNDIVVNINDTAMLTDFGLSFRESGSCSVKKMEDSLGAMA